MVTKRTGISRDLIIHPGETLADLLDDRNITQSELAANTGVSSAYVNQIISGKKGISSKFATALEYTLGVSRKFWLNLQANYDAELAEYEDLASITEDERTIYRHLAEIVKYLKSQNIIPATLKDASELILRLRSILQVGNLTNLGNVIPAGSFRVASGSTVDPYVMGAWFKLCQQQCNSQSVNTTFEVQSIASLIDDLKNVMRKSEVDPNLDIESELGSALSKYGIAFSIVKNFRGAPVQGFITRSPDGICRMALTIRGSFADIFWFSLFHELGHLVNNDVPISTKFIDGLQRTSKIETAADLFAQNALLDGNSYSHFIAKRNFTLKSISEYASSQGVIPCIVIGRLQKEKVIPYSRFSSLRPRYKWAN